MKSLNKWIIWSDDEIRNVHVGVILGRKVNVSSPTIPLVKLVDPTCLKYDCKIGIWEETKELALL